MTTPQISLSDQVLRSPSRHPGAVDVIIVNWNSGRQLQACLSSIAQVGGPAVRSVIVVDNDSADQSADDLDANGVKLTVIRAGSNLGFGRACNMGAALAEAPLLLFLNPDAALKPGALERAVDFILGPEGTDIAVVGVKLTDAQGRVQHHTTDRLTFGKIFTHRQRAVQFDHLHNRRVHHVIGAFYLIRSAVFQEVGGYDERFFMYLEDVDLSDRVHRAGWQVQYLADAHAFHKGGGVSEQIKARRLFYSLRSRLQYSLKHFAVSEAVLVTFITLTLEPLLRLIRAITRASLLEVKETLVAFGLLYRSLPELFSSHER